METESGLYKISATYTFLLCFKLVKISSGNVQLNCLLRQTKTQLWCHKKKSLLYVFEYCYKYKLCELFYWPRKASTSTEILLMALRKMCGRMRRHSCWSGSMTCSLVRAWCKNLGVLLITSGRHRSTGLLSMCRKRNQHCATQSLSIPSGIIIWSSTAANVQQRLFSNNMLLAQWQWTEPNRDTGLYDNCGGKHCLITLFNIHYHLCRVPTSRKIQYSSHFFSFLQGKITIL